MKTLDITKAEATVLALQLNAPVQHLTVQQVVDSVVVGTKLKAMGANLDALRITDDGSAVEHDSETSALELDDGAYALLLKFWNEGNYGHPFFRLPAAAALLGRLKEKLK